MEEEIQNQEIEEIKEEAEALNNDIEKPLIFEDNREREEIQNALRDDRITPEELSKMLMVRVKKDKDAVVAITGEEGSGKSTLAILLIMENLKLQGKTEDEIVEQINEYIMYSPNREELDRKIIHLPRYSCINADEAIKILYKQNWASTVQRYLNMLYAICRQENKITILCMPRFTDFNEFFRNHRIKYWIHVLDRGEAVLFSKDFNPFNDDPWFMQVNKKLVWESYRRKKITDFSVSDQFNTFKRLVTYVGKVSFGELPIKIKHTYLKNKAEHAGEDMYAQTKDAAPRNSIILQKYQNGMEHLIEYVAKKYGAKKGELYNEAQITASTIHQIRIKRGDTMPGLRIPKPVPVIVA